MGEVGIQWMVRL